MIDKKPTYSQLSRLFSYGRGLILP